MFEITGDDVQKLDDVQLRTLVLRLAIAQLRAAGLPIDGVTAGGQQDAADGGIDVRVEVAGEFKPCDFIRRVPLGIQVKKSDMPRAEILKEMKSKGSLKPVIGKLADAGGAYIVVSAQGTLADQRLTERRNAMNDAVKDHESAHKLHVDFYDRERLANWVNQYPCVAAWVRKRIGKHLAGWQPIGDWVGLGVGGDGTYITDDFACLFDMRSTVQTALPIIAGIAKLRETLAEAGQCVRLIGLSGLGKTRLVEALFESEVGKNALDPALAVYTDYAETPVPTATQLASTLVETGQRAILIVDNCNPQIHGALTKICGKEKSKISLITVEYDVQDDEPEGTEVFRLQAASEGTVKEWIKSNFAHVSQVDRNRIVQFSGGNFRVAGVLAKTIQKGDTLGNLKDQDLFRRIFQQRNDHSEDLLKAAETLALVYSFDGEDTSSTGELALLASLVGIDADKLYADVAELKKRSVVQSRGRWRAILPHAIANRLAGQALERIPPDKFDAFCASLPERLQKSLSRRIGYLHDKDEAQQAVIRWLLPDGPLGDLLANNEHTLRLLENIAPVAPEAVLQRIENAIETTTCSEILDPESSHRRQITGILKSLAYDSDLFDRATKALAKFVEAEAPDQNHNSARGQFEELFHIYLSGTQATPTQRRNIIQFFYDDPKTNRCGHLALGALLKTGSFSSLSNFDFGARSRDYGWHPQTNGDNWAWYRDAITLAVTLSADTERRQEIRKIVAGKLQGLLGKKACLAEIEVATTDFLKDGEWLDGWRAIKEAICFDGDKWQPVFKERVLAMEQELRPSDPLNLARVYILGKGSFGLDLKVVSDDEKAQAMGREFGSQDDLLSCFLDEALQSDHSPRDFPFGKGLAESGVPHEEMWELLRKTLISLPTRKPKAPILGGFLQQVHKENAVLATEILDNTLVDSEMEPHFVYLQLQAGIDDDAIERLTKAIKSKKIDARYFYGLASGVIRTAPQHALASMLMELCALKGGSRVAIEIFIMAIYCIKDDAAEIEESLLDAGLKLLLCLDYNSEDIRFEDDVQYIIRDSIEYCCTGPAGESRTEEYCRHLKRLITEKKIDAVQLGHVFETIFETQPLVALNEFLIVEANGSGDPIYGDTVMNCRLPLEQVKPNLLWEWTDLDPTVRYPIIGRSLHVFATENCDGDGGLSTLFVDALDRSPDRALFLKYNSSQMRCLVNLEGRKTHLSALSEHSDDAVRSWVQEGCDILDEQIALQRGWEREREESFDLII